MSTRPLITVVIPVLDRRDLVVRTLDSMREQTHRPLRIIIVDNGSADDTLEVVSRWAALNSSDDFEVKVESCAEGGACGARNRGLESVDTEYVAFFDSDDVMLPRHLERVAAELVRHPETDILYYDVAFIDADGWIDIKRTEDTNLMRAHLLHGALSTNRYVARTQLVRDAGGWNPDCLRWNDLDLGVRLLLMEPQTRKLTGEPTVHLYPTAVSITGTGYYDPDHRCEHALDLIEATLRPVDRPLEKHWTDCRRAILAAWYTREGHRDEAARLMRSVLSKGSLADALRLRAVYLATRLAGHGGAFLSAFFYHPPKPRRPLRR